MAPSATPPKSTLRSRLHMRPSTSMKVSRVAIFALLALISVQTVGSTLLWYAGKIKADSSSRVVTTSPATDVTTTTASLHGGFDYPDGVTQRGFQYGLTTGYGSTVVDGSDPSSFALAQELTDITGGYGFTMDASGNMYRADFDGNTTASIKKYDSTGSLIAEFGSQGSGNGEFNQPFDLFLDGSGNIYVADNLNHRIQKLDSSGNYISQFSTLEQGTGSLVGPSSLTVDSLGNVYVAGGWDADLSYWGVDRQPIVQKYNAAGVLQNQLISSSGTGSNQLATWAEWQDLAVDASNNLYITDQSNTRILKYGSDASFVAQWSIGMSAGHIYAAADGQIYISDQNGYTARVYNQNGNLLREWQASNGPGYIGGIAANAQGDIWIALAGGPGVNGIVWKGKPSIDAPVDNLACDTTYHYRAFATDADSTDYGADSTFTTEPCTGLRTITTLPANNLSQTGAALHGATDYTQGITGRGFQYGLTASYGSSVADNTALPKYGLASQYGSIGSGDGQFSYASGVAVDTSNNRYVVDQNNHRVQKFDSSGNFLLSWGTNGSGDGQFSNPAGITLDTAGGVYVSERTGNRVQKFDSSGNFLLKWGMNSPAGLATDSSNNIYVVGRQDSRVQKFDSSGNFLLSWGTNGSGDGQFNQAFGVTVDPAGNVYIADSSNHSVQKFTSLGAFISRWGGVDGSGDGQFSAPRAVSADYRGHIYVTDDALGRVQEFGSDGSFIAKFNITAQVSNGLIRYNTAISRSGEIITANGAGFAVFSTAIDASISSLACSTTYHYRPYVTDRGGTQYGNDATFTTSACPPLDITTTILDDGVVGVSYSELITVDNLSGGETYSISSGALPTRLSIDLNTGFITGTPSQAGTFNFDVTVENAGSSDIVNLSITVADFANPLSITTASLPDAVLATYYQEFIYTSDSVSDVAASVVSGSLPDGMSLASYGTSGVVYGTPTTPGNYTFTVQAQDSRGAGAGIDTQEYSITVAPSNIQIATTSLPSGLMGLPYNKSIEYEYANAQPVFSLASGALPPGVSLTLQGYLQGVPTQSGTYEFTVQADDGFSTDTQVLSLLVEVAAPITPNAPFVTITSPVDGVSTGSTKLDVAGIGPAGNKVIQVTIDNVVQGTTNTDNEGKWTYQASGLNPGPHTLSATWIPGDDVAFVPFLNPETYSTGISVIDNASLQTVKTIYLPEYSMVYGVTLNHARTKLYAYGGQVNLGEGELTSSARLWEVDLATMAIRAVGYPDSSVQIGFVTTVSISPDDTGVVLLKMEGGEGALEVYISRVDLPGLTPTGTDIRAEALNTPAVLDSFFELALARAYTYSTDSQQRYLYLLLDALDDAPSSNEVVVIDTLDGSSSTIELGEGAEYIPKAIQTVGDRLYVLTSSHVLTIDTVTGGVLSDTTPGFNIDGSAVGLVVFDVAPDGLTALLSISGLSNSTTVVSIDLILGQANVLSDGIETSRQLARAIGKKGPIGIGATSDGSRLYISFNGFSVLDMANRATIDVAGLLPPGVEASGITSYDYIAPIRPKDTISFTVAAAPVDCKVTGTCPTVDCAVTNSCLVNPPSVDPPAPATVGTSSTQNPRIVTTPFPPAAPTVSRLGWFDRGVLAVARFVPRQAAIGFPFLLFLLLLLFALSLYYQSANEVRKDKLNRQFLAKRKSIRAQQDNFIALASHYLNTPITIIQNGIEVMEDEAHQKRG